MGMIFINRNRQSLGQFTEQEVADGLHSGQFLPDDLAWQEPMESWQPLSSFERLPQPSLRSVTGAPPEILPTTPGREARVEPSWERDDAGLVSRLYETCRDVLSRPVEVFKSMPTDGGYGRPMKFYVIIGWLTGIVAIIYQAAAAFINPEMMLGEKAADLSPTIIGAIFVALIVFMPLLLIIGSFVSAGVMHVALMITGGTQKPFEATYRALAYAYGAASVVQLIPICGGYLYTVATLVYGVIALKETHETQLWRPIVAILVVLLLCCGLVIGGGVLIAGAASSLAR